MIALRARLVNTSPRLEMHEQIYMAETFSLKKTENGI